MAQIKDFLSAGTLTLNDLIPISQEGNTRKTTLSDLKTLVADGVGVQINDIATTSTTPTTPSVNDLWIDTTSTPYILKCYSGTEFVQVGSSNSGTQEILIQDTEPTDTTKLWLNTSNGNPVLNWHNGSSWVDNKIESIKLKQSDSCQEIGYCANTIGYNNLSITDYSYTEGTNNLSDCGNLYSIESVDFDNKKITLDNVTGLFTNDKLDIISQDNMFGSVLDVTITDITGFVVTLDSNVALVNYYTYNYAVKRMFQYPTHSEGSRTMSLGVSSHSEGNNCISIGNYSHSEGNNCIAKGFTSHVEGDSCITNGNWSHAEGSGTIANGDNSHTEGNGTIANVYNSHVMGQYNKVLTGNIDSYSATADAFVIGNGTDSSNLNNAFRVTFDGATYGLSAFNSSGADYSEYCEFADGNINKEDRVGYFVTYVDYEALKNITNDEYNALTDQEKQMRLDAIKRGQQIRKANSTDNYILGIVSATPSVIGDSCQDDWNEKYVKDDWGRIQYHDVDVPETKDKDGKIIREAHTETIPILNPNWDCTKEYIPREKRPEWSPVGMLGKLLVRDDGTCEINGYCKSNDDGIATKSETGYRVIGRINDNIIKVLFK